MAKCANKSWGGRFTSAPDEIAARLTDSQHYDRALYSQDIRASKAHAGMLGRQGIITREEAEKIRAGLDAVLSEIESGKFHWRPELEDVHMNIEARLTELIGDAGKKLHTGRSRNDQVGLTFRMFVADQCETWQKQLINLCQTIFNVASVNQDVIMPGYTHLQPAQPVFLAQHLLAYAGMFKRDWERLEDALKRIRVSPLGAAALAGSTFPLDPQSAAAEAGFPKIYENSMDAVSDRDFVAESLFCASLVMTHLSRLCEEIILWANPAFNFVLLPDAFSTGSSIMPQKKNPDVAELIRGKTGRVYGALVGILTILKGLPLAYNRDLQEDKEGFLDASATVDICLSAMAPMLAALTFNSAAMAAACKKGFINATELADYLAAKGIPFRDAHHITGKVVALAEKAGKDLEDLSLKEFQSVSPVITEDIYPLLDYHACARRRETPGGTGQNSIRLQLAHLAEWLAQVETD